MAALLNQEVKRKAVIDLGTNTFNLLIVDWEGPSFTEVFTTKVGVGLGLGGINQNRIQTDAIDRALKTLHDYKDKCEELNVKQIYAFGTSAIRNATNQFEFVAQVKKETGINIQVISGAKEAEFIFKGVIIGLNDPNPFIVMDIGGGSTEFIWGEADELKKAKSFEIGAARIFQQFEFSDPFTMADCEKIERYLEDGTGAFFNTIKVERLIGASGSFETFYELISDKDYPDNTYVEIEKETLMKALDKVIFSTKLAREKNDRIIPIRKKMAPIAGVKIRWIIRKLNIQKIMISPYSLKEGVINEVMR